mmetsp:Transcript_21913/g.44252  ORF Transcript_21913/g.44252 Transcript_21913/m.44252 type:complete len:284 (-) Transcript_21913:718-1569(-)
MCPADCNQRSDCACHSHAHAYTRPSLHTLTQPHVPHPHHIRCRNHPHAPRSASMNRLHVGDDVGELVSESDALSGGLLGVDIFNRSEHNVSHLIEVLVLKREGQAHVHRNRDELLRLWHIDSNRRVLPVAEVARVVLRAEEGKGHASSLGVVEEGGDLVGAEMLEVELDGIAHGTNALRDGGHLDVLAAGEACRHLLVPCVVHLYPLLESVNLRADAASSQVGHAERVVRGLFLDGVEDGPRWRAHVVVDQLLVASRVADGASGRLLVVGAKEATLARVDHLG